jgi:hypothetical protein
MHAHNKKEEAQQTYHPQLFLVLNVQRIISIWQVQ